MCWPPRNSSPPASAVAQPLFTNVTATNLPQAPDLHSLDAEFGDVDMDGDLDILIAVENGANRLYINDGQANFTWAMVRARSKTSVNAFRPAKPTAWKRPT